MNKIEGRTYLSIVFATTSLGQMKTCRHIHSHRLKRLVTLLRHHNAHHEIDEEHDTDKHSADIEITVEEILVDTEVPIGLDLIDGL